jgi:hypothetical protein
LTNNVHIQPTSAPTAVPHAATLSHAFHLIGFLFADRPASQLDKYVF